MSFTALGSQTFEWIKGCRLQYKAVCTFR